MPRAEARGYLLTKVKIMRISQIVISSEIKFSKQVSVFTEQGVAMQSGILNSDRAIEANIQIMRAFVKLGKWLSPIKTWSAGWMI